MCVVYINSGGIMAETDLLLLEATVEQNGVVIDGVGMEGVHDSRLLVHPLRPAQIRTPLSVGRWREKDTGYKYNKYSITIRAGRVEQGGVGRS